MCVNTVVQNNFSLTLSIELYTANSTLGFKDTNKMYVVLFYHFYAMRRRCESVNTKQKGCLSGKLQKFTRKSVSKTLTYKKEGLLLISYQEAPRINLNFMKVTFIKLQTIKCLLSS